MRVGTGVGHSARQEIADGNEHELVIEETPDRFLNEDPKASDPLGKQFGTQQG